MCICHFKWGTLGLCTCWLTWLFPLTRNCSLYWPIGHVPLTQFYHYMGFIHRTQTTCIDEGPLSSALQVHTEPSQVTPSASNPLTCSAAQAHNYWCGWRVKRFHVVLPSHGHNVPHSTVLWPVSGSQESQQVSIPTSSRYSTLECSRVHRKSP